LPDDELAQLRQHMIELVAANLPISQVRVPLHEALEVFRQIRSAW
jgi:hypothetical protein